jgi:hypothetical protein
MKKIEILRSALSVREDEVLNYQVNIDNYVRAIAKIDAEYADNPPMLAFRDRLAGLLEEHKTEQLKAIVIRDVIVDQLSELEGQSVAPE